MPATTIRIRSASHQALKELAAMTGRSLQDELDQAVEQRRRAVYLEGLKADYAAMRQDPKANAEFQKEVALWDTTSDDGLGKL
jgi:predicted transcriptional regulator